METVDNKEEVGCLVKEMVFCPHVTVLKNPFFSTTPNVALVNVSYAAVVVEEGQIKVICSTCIRKNKLFVPES